MTQAMKTGHKGPCPGCGKVKRLTRDHVVPLAVLNRLGLSSPACNIQPLCANCNNVKAEAIVDYRSPWRRQALRHWLREHGAGHVKVEVGTVKPTRRERRECERA